MIALKNKKRFVLAGLVLPLMVGNLSGCGYLFGKEGIFRDRSDDYLKSEAIPPLKLDPEHDAAVFGQLYVIPDVATAEFEYPDQFVAPRPQALSANVFSEKVKIQSIGQKRWIAINTSPAEVWPRVRSFLNSNSLAVDKTDPEAGRIETAWLQFKDDPDFRDKYQLRIEQGVQPDTAEIHVTHIKMSRSEAPPALVEWPAQSDDKEREGWMVDELSATLASDAGTSSASLLAQTIGGTNKIALVPKNQEPILRMELELGRAWATLLFSAKQEGFRLLEEDSTNRILYVDYQNPEQSEGFFSGWFGGDSEIQYRSLSEVIAHLNLEDNAENRALFPPAAFAQTERLPAVPGYLLLVTQAADAVEVTLRDGYGKQLPAKDARELLTIIRRNLI